MPDKVLVIVRTKDRPLFLPRALASVAAQTATGLVAVVVNDGGDAAQVDAAVEASGLGKRAVVIHHKESRGRSEALNAGLAAVEAELFAIHDDDDSWDPDFLVTTIAWLDEHPDALAVATRTEVVREEIQGDRIVEVERELLAADRDEVTLIQTAWQNYVPPIAMVVRTNVLDRIGRFEPDLPVLEDWEFNLRLLSAGRVGFLVERPMAFWHHRMTSDGTAGNSVVAEASDHEAYDQRIRDDYLRRDLAGSGTGLGLHLAVAQGLRAIDRESDLRWASHNEVVDRWNHSHRDHLTLVAQTLGLEIGRLRGEVLALRETVKQLQAVVTVSNDELRGQLRAAAKPLRQGLRRISQRVDDLWEADKRVARLIRRRGVKAS